MRGIRSNRRGVTLIMVAGVLAILAALGAGFYTASLSQLKSAARYADSVHAELMAQAGIQDAIGRLREAAYLKIEDASDRWYTTDFLHGASRQISFPALDFKNRDTSGLPMKKSFSRALQNSTGDADSDTFTLEVTDASSKININACDNLGVLLDNLCRAIGAPLVAANLDYMQPRVWSTWGAVGYGTNTNDTAAQGACYYMPTKGGNQFIDITQPPVLAGDGTALYGDGYAIARYRAVNGVFGNITDVKSALTYMKHPGHPELEALEVEIKFAAIKDYITIDSWIDRNTVCTGKFEWVNNDILIDRDKSWVEDVGAVADPKNTRGSLRGCYVSILTGAGAGTLRRIKTNGVDWIQIDVGFTKTNGKPVAPGPLSSYMIVAKEPAITEEVENTFSPTASIELPKVDSSTGNLVPDPNINYDLYPLCIHRAPININTASDKVLTAMFMGINITHAHYMSIGTDVDVDRTYNSWYTTDPHGVESRISTLNGTKRVPVSTGTILYDKPFVSIVPNPLPSGYSVDYLNNYGASAANGQVTEAHELALRVIMARQSPPNVSTGVPIPAADPYNAFNSKNSSGYKYNYLTGPFKSWDDFYFRVVQPWDLLRYQNDNKRGHAAPMVMAAFNSNTDILKFNPGIEWIDRWGRNFTEMEPIMTYNGNNPVWIAGTDPVYGTTYATYIIRNMRYKADEMIDKTDINRATTEFCFDSGGIFEIHSTGRVTKDGEIRAERRLEALVQIYDVWRETTQAQFVNGTISEAATRSAPDGAIADFSHSGKIVRDGINHGTGVRLALDTLPEPLVPVHYTLNTSGRNKDVVDTAAPNGRNIFGELKTADVPDTIVNRIQPASYDGQIVLATNTARYNPANEEKNTFLASFNGELDTDTSVGNGREQAKSPGDRTTRVLDTCGLLGVLGDDDPRHIDFDQQDGTQGNYNTFRIQQMNQGLTPLNANNYWEGVTLRQGDLRAEGVWLGYCGVSGNDGTIKYLVDVSGTSPGAVRKNFNPEDGLGSTNGLTVCMWFKSVWAADDNMYHEFLNADNPGQDASARYFALVKGEGQPQSPDANALTSSFEDELDDDCQGTLYGGATQNPTTRATNNPAYRVQPFRWSFVGGIYKYNVPVVADGNDFQGYGYTSDPTRNNAVLQICRPFINTQRDPEGPRWTANWFYSRLNAATQNHCDIGAPYAGGPTSYPQEAQWSWADGGTSGKPVFGANNLNKSQTGWLYRYTPIDGTMAVVDEYKVSKLAWDTNLISRVMSQSRYYLPTNPGSQSECPTFTSQSMQQSLHGITTTTSKVPVQSVQPIRIGWNCFTPRFMHEAIPVNNPNGGPFKYTEYNLGILDTKEDDKMGDPTGVLRPTLLDYQKLGAKQSFAVSGIEIELLNNGVPIAGSSETSPGIFTAKGTAATPFSDPNVFNRFPVDTPAVPADKLQYLVRFRYPIDPNFGGGTVNPSLHYLLDTPVFDDIWVTYSIPTRMINYREVSE